MKSTSGTWLDEVKSKENEFWASYKNESLDLQSIERITSKLKGVDNLIKHLKQYHQIFDSSESVLELGAGDGWGACVVKKWFGIKYVIATDISEHAMFNISHWERILETKIDKIASYPSYDIKEKDESLDCIFCFASAHHFFAHRRTLNEIFRVLKPGGCCLYLHEPTCTKLLYKLAFRRVNRKRNNVPEDVLIRKKIQMIAEQIGFQCKIELCPIVQNRAPIESIYYLILSKLPILTRIFPCTANFIMTKPV